jgi:hypothetical protein
MGASLQILERDLKVAQLTDLHFAACGHIRPDPYRAALPRRFISYV